MKHLKKYENFDSVSKDDKLNENIWLEAINSVNSSLPQVLQEFKSWLQINHSGDTGVSNGTFVLILIGVLSSIVGLIGHQFKQHKKETKEKLYKLALRAAKSKMPSDQLLKQAKEIIDEEGSGDKGGGEEVSPEERELISKK